MDFYSAQVNKNSDKNPMYGLNSKLIKENGKLVEKIWIIGSMYSPAIEKIVYWLKKASSVSERFVCSCPAQEGTQKISRSFQSKRFPSMIE